MARPGALTLVPGGPSWFGLVSPPVAIGVAIRPFANSQVAAVGPSFARTPFHLGRERRGPLHRDAAVPGASSHRGSWAALAGPKAPPDGTRGGPRHHEFGGRTKHVRMIMHAGIRALVQRTRTPPLCSSFSHGVFRPRGSPRTVVSSLAVCSGVGVRDIGLANRPVH